MSSHQAISTFVNLSRENNRSSKYLAASRWAPGGLEDKMASNNGSAFGCKALAKSKSVTAPTEYGQIGHKDKNKFNYKDSNAIQCHLLQDSHNDNTPTATNTKPTPRRIIGPVSEEEKTVKMENPFFDPAKHKGLGSSRWANE